MSEEISEKEQKFTEQTATWLDELKHGNRNDEKLRVIGEALIEGTIYAYRIDRTLTEIKEMLKVHIDKNDTFASNGFGLLD